MSIEGLDFRNYKINQSIFKDWALCQLKDWSLKISKLKLPPNT